MKKIVFGVLVCSLFMTDYVNGQSRLSLKECLDYGLKNNLSKEAFSNEMAIADQRAIEALSGYLPQVNGTGTLDDNILRPTTIIPGAAFGSPVDRKVQFGNQYATNLALQADQVIYDQSLIMGLKAKKPNKEIANLKFQQNDQEIIYNTMNAYYQVQISQAAVKLLEGNDKKLSEVSAIQKVKLDNGALTKVEYDRVRVNLNNNKSQLKYAQTNQELALNRLKFAIGMPIEDSLSIADTISLDDIYEMPANPGLDPKNRYDFRVESQNINLLDIDYKRKKAALLPSLSSYARVGSQAFGNDFKASYNSWYSYSAIGLKLNVPVFSGLRKNSQIKQSQLTLKSAQSNLKLSEMKMKVEIENSYTKLVNSYATLSTNKENLILAKDVFDNTSYQYERGAASLSDLLNSDYSYKEAQSNYVNSLLNYLIATIELEKSKGNLIQYASQL